MSDTSSPAILPLPPAEPPIPALQQAPPALLLTTDEVAALLKVERRTVERWHSAGKIPGRVQLPGRVVRWRGADVLAWLAGGCAAPPRPRRSR